MFCAMCWASSEPVCLDEDLAGVAVVDFSGARLLGAMFRAGSGRNERENRGEW